MNFTIYFPFDTYKKQTSALQEGSDEHAYLIVTADFRVEKIFEN